MSGHSPLIAANEVWKIYDAGSHAVEAVKGVSLEMSRGEIVAIMGPSGCGKTTLLNCLSGIDIATQGNVIVEGRNLNRLKERERDAFRAANTGFIFQFYNLVPVLSAAENVELPLLCSGVRPASARERALDALARVGLRGRESHRPAELSSGQQQRVALARAIVNRPKVIFADEPTGALDSKTNEMVMDLIAYLNRTEHIAFVIVTHNPDVAGYAHRTLFMDSGQIISERRAARKDGFPGPERIHNG